MAPKKKRAVETPVTELALRKGASVSSLVDLAKTLKKKGIADLGIGGRDNVRRAILAEVEDVQHVESLELIDSEDPWEWLLLDPNKLLAKLLSVGGELQEIYAQAATQLSSAVFVLQNPQIFSLYFGWFISLFNRNCFPINSFDLV